MSVDQHRLTTIGDVEPFVKYDMLTVDTLSTDTVEEISEKIMRNFRIGDLATIAGVCPIHYDNGVFPGVIPMNFHLALVGTVKGYCIFWPKGYLVVQYLRKKNIIGKEFKANISLKDDIYYYQIWRSK